MYLKSLELNGFKSFARKSELEFVTPISAIVGPNGSGKSNIAEAFRFVLGEQSIKSMRGKRGEDLIFNGGGGGNRSNRAGIKVAFDNSKKFLDVDFDEVSIERVVHRDGVNDYFINGSSVRLKDVHELLSKAHIGSSGHHIISQGEADKILNASNRDRKEMIEDALGLMGYQYKIADSLRKFEKTQENIKEIELLRKEIAPHLKFLKRQVEKVEKTRQLRDDLRSQYKEYLKREEQYLEYTEDKIRQEKIEPEQRIGELEGSLREAQAVLSASGMADEKSRKIVEIDEKLSLNRQEKDVLVRDSGRIEGEISSYKRLIERQTNAVHTNENKMIRLTEVELFLREVETDALQTESIEEVSSLKTFITRLRSRITGFLEQRKDHVDDGLIREYEGEIKQLEKQKEDILLQTKQIEDRSKELQQEYGVVQKQIEEEKDSNRDAERLVFSIRAEQSQLRSALEIIRGKAERLRIVREDFERELQEAGVLIGHMVLEFKQFTITHDGRSLTTEEVVNENREEQEGRRRAIEKIKIRLEDEGTGSGEDVVKEHKETEERDQFLAKELVDLERSKMALEQLVTDLQETLRNKFTEGITKINEHFSTFFALMFGGGSASVQVIREKKRRRGMEEIEESEEDIEYEDGVVISISLPRKKVKSLEMLSGGERALTSIALLFAISQVNPPPFIILDETDAALDEANSRKYGDMIESLSELSQLILITHNRETMSRAGIIYGVTMGNDGISKLLSIQFDEAVSVAK